MKDNKKSKKSLKDIQHSLVSAALCLLYAGFFLYLTFSKKIIFFVHPDYAFLSPVSAIILFLLAFLNLFQRSKQADCQECCDMNLFSKKRNMFFVLIPLLLLIAFPIRPLSSATAEIRSAGYNRDAGLSRSVLKTGGFAIRSENRTLVDWIRLFSNDPEPDHYKGQKAKIIGFILKDKSLPENYFLISRFVLSCCAADARPIGIPVQYDRQKFQLNENDWIELSAHFESKEIQNQRQPVLVMENLKKVPIPENPYAE
jgi:uncharacterized repeat protein (TIGR03943 family)